MCAFYIPEYLLSVLPTDFLLCAFHIPFLPTPSQGTVLCHTPAVSFDSSLIFLLLLEGHWLDLTHRSHTALPCADPLPMADIPCAASALQAAASKAGAAAAQQAEGPAGGGSQAGSDSLQQLVAQAVAASAQAVAPFVWVDGPLVTAMRQGDMLLVDEINLADDAVLERLNRWGACPVKMEVTVWAVH